MSPLKAAWCLASLGLWIACSGDDFEGNTGGSAGDAGTAGAAGQDASAGGSAGASGAAGVSGTSGSGGGSGTGGGASGSAGQGGSGGAPCQDGSCPDDQYCHSDGNCRLCTDTTELEFGDPEPLSVINNAHAENLFTPRVVASAGANPLQLFYVVGAYSQRKIWATNDFTQNAGGPIGDPVDAVADAGDLEEAAPLVVDPATDGALFGLVLFFERMTGTTVLDGRRLMGAGFASDKFLTPAQLPPPFNTASDSSWQMAFAKDAKRAWFMSNRHGPGQPKLFTLPTGANASQVADPVPLVTGPNNCQVEQNVFEADLAPWVTRDGKRLFFQARESAPGCTYGGKTDIFTVPLQTNGQSVGVNATRLSVNEPKTADSAPSLSYDMCWLYYASERNLSPRQQLYRARRK